MTFRMATTRINLFSYSYLLGRLFVLISMALVSQIALAELTWYKEGGPLTEEFEKTRENCISNLKSQRFLNIDDCTKKAGWRLIEKGDLDAARKQCRENSQVDGVLSNDKYFACGKEAGYDWKPQGYIIAQENNVNRKAFCSDEKFSSIFAVSPCLPIKIAFEHMANDKKIAQSEKKIFGEYFDRSVNLDKVSSKFQRDFNGIVGRKNAEFFELIYLPKRNQNMLDLYQGKISWGQYNKNRADFNQEFKEAGDRFRRELQDEIKQLHNKNIERLADFNDIQKREQENASQINRTPPAPAYVQPTQRQYDEVEAQNALVRNRESKCLFVKSQEYLRPALGGFFESMNRANSAYENCMAGVPQINTTCTKDAFGNISCTSR